jgi:DNA-directed RNA polymerase subunit RPC12/RpoP
MPGDPAPQKPVPATPVHAGQGMTEFRCATCSKQYMFEAPDPSQQYYCPDCNQYLIRIIKCPNCEREMSITQENFQQYHGKEMQCPSCGKNVPI